MPEIGGASARPHGSVRLSRDRDAANQLPVRVETRCHEAVASSGTIVSRSAFACVGHVDCRAEVCCIPKGA